jgi:hypothetical protein
VEIRDDAWINLKGSALLPVQLVETLHFLSQHLLALGESIGVFRRCVCLLRLLTVLFG